MFLIKTIGGNGEDAIQLVVLRRLLELGSDSSLFAHFSFAPLRRLRVAAKRRWSVVDCSHNHDDSFEGMQSHVDRNDVDR